MEELLKPQQIKEFLDQYVIGQDDAKRYMSVAVYNHYKRLLSREAKDVKDVKDGTAKDDVEIDKSNIVLVGPTGTGKTLMARTIARLLKVPFDRRRHGSHRGGICGRGCGEHSVASVAGCRL